MNLDEWKKICNKNLDPIFNNKQKTPIEDVAQEEDGEEELQMLNEGGVTNNPNDYYFVVVDNTQAEDDLFGGEDPYFIAVTPKKYFNEEGVQWDQPVDGYLALPGFDEIMESTYAPFYDVSSYLSHEQIHNLFLEMGFEYSESFANFIKASY